MSRYQHILVAVDLKDSGDQVVAEQAQLLANASGAKLSVVHVVEPIYSYGVSPGSELQIDDWENSLEDVAKDKLQQFADQYRIPANQQYLKVGIPTQVILETAKNVGADLIVLGHHGRHGIKSLFINDTAEETVHQTECDVLAVHVK